MFLLLCFLCSFVVCCCLYSVYYWVFHIYFDFCLFICVGVIPHGVFKCAWFLAGFVYMVFYFLCSILTWNDLFVLFSKTSLHLTHSLETMKVLVFVMDACTLKAQQTILFTPVVREYAASLFLLWFIIWSIIIMVEQFYSWTPVNVWISSVSLW